MSQWIPWLPDYEVGVPQIDEQHRELFRMFNELMDATWDGKGKEHAKASLAFLADYVVKHFAMEESLMQRHDYSGYAAHKKIHDDFSKEVGYFIEEYHSKEINTDLLVQMVLKVGQWTRDHIRSMDLELGRLLVSKEIGRRT
ncbi:MAG: bacteriohemerythrin [Deltaproteobacteria bacterium]|nr:bacteriohemerythrin [Deltaproteobacteria bacterium]